MSTTLHETSRRPRAGIETMHAVVVHAFDEPPRVEEVAKPIPGPGEILVKIEASGLCHTDIHAAHGDWPVKPNLPFIPGHEGVGIVEALGTGVAEVVVGDRVAIPWLGYACGVCDYCVSGWETLCESQQNTGYSVDGGFAEYTKAHARYVVKVPAGIDPFDAAPLTCAGVTTYKAVKMSGAKPADLVAVWGIGGLGHLALQYARIAGASVVAVDLFDEKLELARELGAEFTVNAARAGPGRCDQAARRCRRGRRSRRLRRRRSSRPLPRCGVAVTMCARCSSRGEQDGAADLRDSPQRHHVVGSIVGTRLDLREVFELHAAGKTRVIREERPLDDVHNAMEDVLRGDVPARIVLRP